MGPVSKHWYIPLILLFALAAVAIGCGGNSEHDKDGDGNIDFAPENLDGITSLRFDDQGSAWFLETQSGFNGAGSNAIFTLDDASGSVYTVNANWVYTHVDDTNATFELDIITAVDGGGVHNVILEDTVLTFTLKFTTSATSATYTKTTNQPGGTEITGTLVLTK